MTFKLVQVVKVSAQPAHQLALVFSDGSAGVLDLSGHIARGGPMLDPLRDQDFFERVFVEMGVPTWPNGYDIDAINARMTLEAAGELTTEAAAA